VNKKSSILGEAIRATNIEKQSQAGNTENGNAVIPESQLANLTIKVHKRYRLHWLIEAKKQGTSLTAAITEALNARFGAPE
jgi:hypothetical protein